MDFELHILDSLFENKTETRIGTLAKSLSFSRKINVFYDLLFKNLDGENILEKKFKNVSTLNSKLYIISILLFNPLLLLVTFVFRKDPEKYTENGVQKYSEAISLRNFLVSQDDQLNFQADNQMFFEKLLSFATAFGVEKIWINRFKDMMFEKSEWLEGDMHSGILYSSFSKKLNSSISNSSHISATSSSSGFSSGFSGGSSGGGGGGGGGGSW